MNEALAKLIRKANFQKQQRENETNETRKVNAFLVLSGTFNPIHRMHIKVLETAKQHIDVKTNWHILGAFVVPSTDEYAHGKLGDDAMSLTLRCKLIDLVIGDSDWITSIYTAVQGWETAQIIQKALFEVTGEEFTPFVVMGADVVVKYRYHIYPVIAISREEKENEMIREWIRNHEVHQHFIYIEIEHQNFVISSSRIRKYLQCEAGGSCIIGDGDDDAARERREYLKNSIHENVLVYLQNDNINKYEQQRKVLYNLNM
jgi:nicotinic acid mononucleotide adenylyltransferase